MAPRLRACMAPAGPQRTSSRAGGSLTMVRRKSEAAATSCGDLASLAPAATSSSAREAVRFQTVSAWPAFKRFMPMGRPMRPSPMSPIFLGAAADSKKASSKAAGAKRAGVCSKRGDDCSRIAERKQRGGALVAGRFRVARHPPAIQQLWDQFPERDFSVQSGCALENAQERDQVRFLLRRENKAKAALVKLHGIQQSLSGSVMVMRGVPL